MSSCFTASWLAVENWLFEVYTPPVGQQVKTPLVNRLGFVLELAYLCYHLHAVRHKGGIQKIFFNPSCQNSNHAVMMTVDIGCFTGVVRFLMQPLDALASSLASLEILMPSPACNRRPSISINGQRVKTICHQLCMISFSCHDDALKNESNDVYSDGFMPSQRTKELTP